MKTLSSIQLNDQEDDFQVIRMTLKISILSAALFVSFLALDIPIF